MQKLEAELDKVAAFRSIKGDELARRIQHCESSVANILKTSGDDLSRFAGVQEEITRITVEVNELSKFVRLNYSGFLKVKHS